MKNLFRQAHEMTREIIKEYEDVDYQAQFTLCLQFLSEEVEEIKNKSDLEQVLIKEIVKESGSTVRELNLNVNEWENYGRHRIYIEARFLNRGSWHDFKSYIVLKEEDRKEEMSTYYTSYASSRNKARVEKRLFKLISNKKYEIKEIA